MPAVLLENARTARAHADRFPPFLVNREQAEWLILHPPTEGSESDRTIEMAYALLRAGRTQEAIDLLGGISESSRDVKALLALAYLRRGEETNCLTRGHAPEVCILPFRGAAVHADPAPARRAARLFSDLLDEDPDDLGSRWLLNVAHQALGDYPGGVPAAHLIPGIGEPEGDFPRLRNIAAERGLATMSLAGGASMEDFDGDGDLDLMTTSWGLGHPVRYFANDGRGAFTERTHEAGLDGITSAKNVIHGDIDNDGDADALVLRGGWLGHWGTWPNSLLRNDGGTFTDITFQAGMGEGRPSQKAAFADVDGDGWLDLFIGNESGRQKGAAGQPFPTELFLNNRDGTFRDVAPEAGLAVEAFVKGVAWGDVDSDGRPDLYLSILGSPNRLFLNRSQGGAVRFEEAPDAAGAAGSVWSFPVTFLDWDQDGDDDLLSFAFSEDGFTDGTTLAAAAAAEALGLLTNQEPTRLFRNDGGTFTDVSREAGLDRFAFPVMGVNVEDMDGDGTFDIYAGTGGGGFSSLVPNRLFMGTPGGRFVDRTYASGTGHLQKGHGVSFGDIDGDLDPDLFVLMGGAYDSDTATDVLFENPWQDRGWVVLRLEGRQANRSAIGAHVAIRVRDPNGTALTLWRTVRTGACFGSNSLQLEVGLNGGNVEAVEVTWPGSGTRDVFRDVERGGRYRLVEGATAAEPIELTIDPVPARQPSGHDHGAS